MDTFMPWFVMWRVLSEHLHACMHFFRDCSPKTLLSIGNALQRLTAKNCTSSVLAFHGYISSPAGSPLQRSLESCKNWHLHRKFGSVATFNRVRQEVASWNSCSCPVCSSRCRQALVCSGAWKVETDAGKLQQLPLTLKPWHQDIPKLFLKRVYK